MNSNPASFPKPVTSALTSTVTSTVTSNKLVQDGTIDYSISRKELDKRMQSSTQKEKDDFLRIVNKDITEASKSNDTKRLEVIESMIENKTYSINKGNRSTLINELKTTPDKVLLDIKDNKKTKDAFEYLDLYENLDNASQRMFNRYVKIETKERIEEALSNEILQIRKTTIDALIRTPLHLQEMSYISKMEFLKGISKRFNEHFRPLGVNDLSLILDSQGTNKTGSTNGVIKGDNPYYDAIKEALEAVNPVDFPLLQSNMTKKTIDIILRENQDSLLFDKISNIFTVNKIHEKQLNEALPERLKESNTDTINEANNQSKNEEQGNNETLDYNVNKRYVRDTFKEIQDQNKLGAFKNNTLVLDVIGEEIDLERDLYSSIKSYLKENDITLDTLDDNLCGAYIKNTMLEETSFFKSAFSAIQDYLDPDNTRNITDELFEKDDDVDLVQIEGFNFAVQATDKGYLYEFLHDKSINDPSIIERFGRFGTDKNSKKKEEDSRGTRKEDGDRKGDRKSNPINESADFGIMKVKAYNFLKKEKGIMPLYYEDDFDATEIIPFDGMKIYYNDRDFNKPIFALDWD